MQVVHGGSRSPAAALLALDRLRPVTWAEPGYGFVDAATPDTEQRRQAGKMYDAREITVEEIGRVLGVARTAMCRALADSRPVPAAAARGAHGAPADAQPDAGAGCPARRGRRSS